MGGFAIDNTPAPAATGAARDGEIQRILDQQPTWAKPLSDSSVLASPIYAVVYDTASPTPDCGGNGGGNYTTTIPGTTIPINLKTNGFWVSAPGNNRDAFTRCFSHELVERISDGTGTGIKVKISNDQISDGEAQNYAFRVGASASLVQSYWSILHRAYVVPGAPPTSLVLDPTSAGRFVTLRWGNLYNLTQAVSPNGTPIDTRVSDYVVTPLGNIYDLTIDGLVKSFNMNTQTWLPITGRNTRASALAWTGAGLFMAAANTGEGARIWRYTGVPNKWIPINSLGSNVTQIATWKSQLYVLSSQRVFRFNPTFTLTPITGPLTRVHSIAATTGGLYMLATNDVKRIWKYAGTPMNWTPLTGANTNIVSFGVSLNLPHILASLNGSLNKVVYQFSGIPRTWTPITGPNTIVKGLFFGGDELYIDATNSGLAEFGRRVWRYMGSSQNWTALTGLNTKVNYVFLNGPELFMNASNNGSPFQNWRYTHISTQWTAIP